MTFRTVEEVVTRILEKNTATRDDDMLLYVHYVYLALPQKAISDDSMVHIFSNNRYRIENGVAPYETVSRIRRKVQEIRRDLRPTEYAKQEKRRAEKEYRKYAKGVKE